MRQSGAEWPTAQKNALEKRMSRDMAEFGAQPVFSPRCF
jgi:hypothetical protein